MILSFGLTGMIIVLEAGPVYQIVMVNLRGHHLSMLQIIWVTLSFVIALFLCIFASIYPIHRGIKFLNLK